MTLQKKCKPFSELTPHELYDIIRLRVEVFIVEQNCIFQDLDNKDQHCSHLMFYNDDALVAYARIVPPGLAYSSAMSIGRVITSATVRGTGTGFELMTDAINYCYKFFGKNEIKIGAQLYAKAFYERLGFKQSGAVYLEDGIDHIEMTKI
jgi:ElaA protein